MKREKLAESYFLKGYSCSQAVVLAYQDLIKLKKDDLLKLASPFGGGIGRLREVCGALSGALIVLGYLKGNPTTDLKKKEELYQTIQKIAAEFKKENGAIVCRELLHLRCASSPKPSKRNEKYYHARPCLKMVNSATRILEKYLD
ncbi:MAG: C-GCAxxG-C-C family protein [Bacilli bacterium]|nr:C-GCAxxG-C-C family protein [Bacilli bacterium]